MTYTQSNTIEEVKRKHPFPWREQRAGGLVRMVDATGNEVGLFEITALAVLVTHNVAFADKKAPAQ